MAGYRGVNEHERDRLWWRGQVVPAKLAENDHQCYGQGWIKNVPRKMWLNGPQSKKYQGRDHPKNEG